MKSFSVAFCCLVVLAFAAVSSEAIVARVWPLSLTCAGVTPLSPDLSTGNNTCTNKVIPSPFAAGSTITISYRVNCQQFSACSPFSASIWLSSGCDSNGAQPIIKDASTANATVCYSHQQLFKISMKGSCGDDFNTAKCDKKKSSDSTSSTGGTTGATTGAGALWAPQFGLMALLSCAVLLISKIVV